MPKKDRPKRRGSKDVPRSDAPSPPPEQPDCTAAEEEEPSPASAGEEDRDTAAHRRLPSVRPPIGETRGNLRQRQEWFRKRSGGSD